MRIYTDVIRDSDGTVYVINKNGEKIDYFEALKRNEERNENFIQKIIKKIKEW